MHSSKIFMTAVTEMVTRKNVTGMKISYQGVIFGENSKKPDVYICYVFKWPE